MNHRTDILDLRTALVVLRQTPGQLVETDVEVDPEAELSGVYRYVGAGGTVMRPTKVDGPAMVFHNVKGHQCGHWRAGKPPAGGKPVWREEGGTGPPALRVCQEPHSAHRHPRTGSLSGSGAPCHRPGF